jgi:hypothetical protein
MTARSKKSGRNWRALENEQKLAPGRGLRSPRIDQADRADPHHHLGQVPPDLVANQITDRAIADREWENDKTSITWKAEY